MIGTVLRFKLKKTLIGIAAISLLVPMASHADVTKGRWIFDGFSRATRDGQGSTCVSSGGDTHAFAIEDCNAAASQSEAVRQKALQAKKAARAAADAEKAASRAEAARLIPGGQQDFRVKRADGIRILDGFGRDCIRDGSAVAGSTADCSNPAPQPSFGDQAAIQASRAAAAEARKAAPPPAPVAPGSLINGESPAYVREVDGTTIRDGFGRSCIKDGRWQTGLATEECDPDLFNQWRSKTAAPQAAVAPAPQAAPAPAPAPAPVADANGPSQPDAGPGTPPPPEKTAAATAPVIDNTLPVFPITTYSFTPDVAPTEPLPAVAELAAAENAVEDEVDDTVARADDVDDDEAATLVDEAAAPDDADADTLIAADDDAPSPKPDDSPLAADTAMPFIAGGSSTDVEDESDETAADDDGWDDETAYLGDGDLPGGGIPDGVATAVEDEADDAVNDGDAWDDEPTYLGDTDIPGGAAGIPDGVATDVEDETDDAVAEDLMPDDKTAYLGDGDLPDHGIPDGVATPVEDEIDDTPSTDVAAWDDESAYLGDGNLPEAAPVVVADKPAPAPVTAPAVPAKSEPAPVVADTVRNVECPPVTIEMEGGRFAFDRYSLRADAIAKLDHIADLLKSSKCESINITGHTDRIGTLKYNQQLSERRAISARNYLVKEKGIDATLITTNGLGETQPVTTQAQCKGKRKAALIKCYAPDRRVFVTATLRKPAN